MKKIIFTIGFLAATVASASTITGQITGTASTLGLGIEYSKSMSENTAIRFGYSGYSFDIANNSSGTDFDSEVTASNISATYDYYINNGPFRVSAGIINFDMKATGVAQASTDYTFDGVTYSSGDLGSITSSFGMSGVSPYASIGVAKNPTNSGFGISFDIGLAKAPKIQGDISVECASGLTTIQCTDLQANVTNEIDTFNADLPSLSYYPIISAGASYSF